jgi:SAM-dependent methyltransferase
MNTNLGSENLDVMENAPRYLKHVAKLIRRHLPDSGLILDFGAGNGMQTQLIREPSASVVCIENDKRRLDDLRRLGYSASASLEGVETASVAAVFSSNCLEHIADDQAIVKEISRVLEDDGVFVLYVPALQFLFSSMDERVGHVRRYRRMQLKELSETNGFEIISIRYVDSLGVIATLIFKFFGKSKGTPGRWSVKFYDSLIFRLSIALDVLFRQLIGKNLLLVARKPQMVRTHVP